MSRFQRHTAAKKLGVCFLMAFALFGLFLKPVAHAQNAPEKTSQTLSQTFAEYFTAVAAQNHVVIAAENIPLRLTITAEEKQTLSASVQNVSLQKNIALQAAFFDYDTQFIKPNLFVLRKRYANPGDLPYVSLDEAAHFLEVSRRFISRYKSPFKNGSFQADSSFMETARSFTPAQLALMEQSKLPITSLLPAQRQQLWNVMTCFYIDNGILGGSSYSQGSLNTIRTETEGRFQHFASPAENPTPIFAPFGFVYPTPKDRYFKKAVLPLSFQKGRHRTAHGEATVSPEKDAQGNEIPFHDASEPTEADRKAAEEQTRALAVPTVCTLQKLAQRLTDQSAGKTVYVVEEPLQSNPVALFGSEKGNAEATFAACASTYDLRVVEEKNATGTRVLHLTRPIASPPNSLQNVRYAVLRLMPGPYARALHLPEMNTAYAVADAITARTKRTIADRELRRARGENVPDR